MVVITDVSGQPTGPIEGQAVFLTLEDVNDKLSRNVGNILPIYAT